MIESIYARDVSGLLSNQMIQAINTHADVTHNFDSETIHFPLSLLIQGDGFGKAQAAKARWR